MGTITAASKGTPTGSRKLVEMNWDPITRIVGSLGIFTKIDFDNRQVAECHSTSSIFRGYSIFMKGKDPRDAHFITSRICGICGDNHATCATYAQNMAFGVRPPALGEWIVNLGEAAEYMFDHNIFQEMCIRDRLEDPVRWYQQIHPDDKMRWSVEAAEMFLSGRPLRSSYRVIARDGKTLWFQCEAKMIRREDGRPWFIHGVGFDITERKGLEEAILEISAREQRRIAQDLHDGLGQHLTGIAFMSKVLEEKLSDKSLPEAVEAAKIVRMVNQAIDNTRELARGLHPVPAEPLGLMSALRRWASDVEELFHIRCLFQCPRPLFIRDANLATHLYRIAQEAVHNAIRHGKSRNIVVSLSGKNGTGTLTIRDDGDGFQKKQEGHPGVGLSIMNYRADMVGGSLKVQPNEDRGITVTCAFPIRRVE